MMSFSDSMFLFELVLEEFKSLTDCKRFIIKSEFADIFSLALKDPNELEAALPKKQIRKKCKRKLKVRNVSDSKRLFKEHTSPTTIQTGQSILIVNSLDLLISRMKQYPVELSLWSTDDIENKVGSTHIHWDQEYVDYLNKFHNEQSPPPVALSRQYNVFDETTSKRMANIKLCIKLTYLKDKITTQFRSLSEENPGTFMYTGFNSKDIKFLSTVKDTTDNNIEYPTGIIRTIYGSKKNNIRNIIRSKSKKTISSYDKNVDKYKSSVKIDYNSVDSHINQYNEPFKISNIKSDLEINSSKHIELVNSKSCSAINTMKYIFGDNNGPFGNRVYCVGYCTLQNKASDSKKESKPSSQTNSDNDSKSEEETNEKYKIKLCDNECPSKKAAHSCTESTCSVDLPQEAANLISVTKCKQVDCNAKKYRELPTPPDDRILLDLTNSRKECCTEKIEEVVGGMTAKMKLGDDPCYCACECRFGFTKKTTYCNICGGYEIPGEELARKPAYELPTPCPIFHKLVDKNKLKTWNMSGSDAKMTQKTKLSKASEKRSDKISVEPESKKGKKKQKDDKFKFNYGYTGIPPQIGHDECNPHLDSVPNDMGWLWDAEDVPGMKFRPLWKPGAVNKRLLRKLKMAKNPGQVLSKKRKKDTGPKKRPLKRPLLVIHKKDGEYTITMERMKTYPKPRTINQHPYEDKPPLTYTVGRTDEENLERKKKKERQHRRLEREQRQFIQSAFKDMCQEICLKTYQQALGILPNAEDPECPCYPAHPKADKANQDVSCSCSEDNRSLDSDTDSDEWIIEFTPPNATFNPKFKPSNIQKVENTTQYTYLDYKVKLLDRFGNPVPRFFKGPDGNQQCSDLGGFWSPEHKWLEINVDGFIAPDGRWAPNSFIGPNGDHVDSEGGKFQIANGKWLVIGIDGFIDCQGKWRYYPKPKTYISAKKVGTPSGTKKGGAGDKKDKKDNKAIAYKSSEATWSCFGDVTPKELSKLGITGHGQDKKLLQSTFKNSAAHGENVKISQATRSTGGSKKKKRMASPDVYDSRTYFNERQKCRHPVPSDKGIVAVDDLGNKTYFRMRGHKNSRPKQRLKDLKERGISLSSFHMPCFHSFINSEVMKQQLREKLVARNPTGIKSIATQV